jgi:hypothetical protein
MTEANQVLDCDSAWALYGLLEASGNVDILSARHQFIESGDIAAPSVNTLKAFLKSKALIAKGTA